MGRDSHKRRNLTPLLHFFPLTKLRDSFFSPKGACAYQPRVQPWVWNIVHFWRSEGTPHITVWSIHARCMRRSFRTHPYVPCKPRVAPWAGMHRPVGAEVFTPRAGGHTRIGRVGARRMHTLNLENAVQLVNPPDRLLLSVFSCFSWPPIWCPEKRRCGPDARRTMRWNGSRHFEPRATPQMGRSCVFQVKPSSVSRGRAGSCENLRRLTWSEQVVAYQPLFAAFVVPQLFARHEKHPPTIEADVGAFAWGR